jgi:diguanylate cyclase (GGDEF)-like protein/PAS domain S-box-containing protein
VAYTVLIVSNNRADIERLKKTLSSASDDIFRIKRCSTLGDAVGWGRVKYIDIILLDLFLPDSSGLATFNALHEVVPHIPIMIINAGDEALSLRAVESGAYGYVSGDDLENSLIPQSLRSLVHKKKADQALYIELERARITLESLGEGVLCTDEEARITYLNPEAERMTGWLHTEAKGKPIEQVFQLINRETDQPLPNAVRLVIEKKKPLARQEDSVLLRPDGYRMAVEDSVAPILDSNKKLTGAVITFRDVTKTRAMEQKMAHLAQHDYLTGLPNRMLLNDRLTQAVAYAKRRKTGLGVLFCDLDNFKHINDSLGHFVGDKLLQSVAQRLTRQVRASDTVSRHGGDEFVILLLDDLAENAALTAEKILLALSQPYFIGTHELCVTTSIGISLYPDDGNDAESLIRSADTALYQAKSKGRDNYQFFKEEMNARAVERQSLEVDLRRAIKQEEFILHYQPKVNLNTGEITGVEVLIRWNHPTRGIIFPGTFISIAEDCGLIVPLGKWVLEHACQQARAWIDQGHLPMPVAINISALEFRNVHFARHVKDVLDRTRLDPQYLELELTESVLMKDVETSASILRELKEIGVRIAIDDFGTGYSSLNYLNQFPIDVLKIDQSFVRDISSGNGNDIIVNAVINMGISLKQKVVAEGIETREQLAFLSQHDCHEGQGFLLSKPLSAVDLEKVFLRGTFLHSSFY